MTLNKSWDYRIYAWCSKWRLCSIGILGFKDYLLAFNMLRLWDVYRERQGRGHSNAFLGLLNLGILCCIGFALSWVSHNILITGLWNPLVRVTGQIPESGYLVISGFCDCLCQFCMFILLLDFWIIKYHDSIISESLNLWISESLNLWISESLNCHS